VIWVLLLGAGGASIGIALGALGGPFSPRLDVFSHFIPFFLLGVLGAAVVLFLRPNRFEAVGAMGILALGLLSAGCVILPTLFYEQVTARHLDPAAQIKVIQFNALDGNRRGPVAVAWLKAQDADIVVLEEAPDIGRYMPGLGYVASCGNCGAVIFSKRRPHWQNGPTWDWMVRRHVAAASFRDGRGAYTVLGVHRGRPTRFDRTAQEMRALAAMAARFHRESLILVGDFNSTPWSATRRREEATLGLVRQTRAVPTWPAEAVSHNRLGFPFPVLPIDHVYAGRDWATVKVERGPTMGSDHYPVVVTLQRVRNLAPTAPAKTP